MLRIGSSFLMKDVDFPYKDRKPPIWTTNFSTFKWNKLQKLFPETKCTTFLGARKTIFICHRGQCWAVICYQQLGAPEPLVYHFADRNVGEGGGATDSLGQRNAR